MMLLRLASVAVVLALGVSVAIAEEFVGRISKVDGDKITVTKFEKGKKGKGAETTLTTAKKVKVNEAKFSKDDGKFKIETGDEIKGGLKNDRFKDIGKGGIFARITTNDDGKVTNVLVFPAFKGKKKPKKDD